MKQDNIDVDEKIMQIITKHQPIIQGEIIKKLENEKICAPNTAKNHLDNLIKKKKIGKREMKKAYVYSLHANYLGRKELDSALVEHLESCKDQLDQLKKDSEKYDDEVVQWMYDSFSDWLKQLEEKRDYFKARAIFMANDMTDAEKILKEIYCSCKTIPNTSIAHQQHIKPAEKIVKEIRQIITQKSELKAKKKATWVVGKKEMML